MEVEKQRKDEVEQEIANNEIGTSIISVKLALQDLNGIVNLTLSSLTLPIPFCTLMC